jgi:hypothetical protein
MSRDSLHNGFSNYDPVNVLDVHESVHRDSTMKITNKMHYIDEFSIPSQLYMFRAKFSPIIRST